METHYEFKNLPLLTAIAMGVPGKRTFFLVLGEKDDWVRVWLEKEQLEALGLAIEQFLFSLSREGIYSRQDPKEGGSPTDTPSGFPSAEVEIDQITLGYEDENATLGLVVHGMGPERETQAEMNCRISLSQFQQLGDQAARLCAAGRPRCQLCGGPIDPEGHVCPERN